MRQGHNETGIMNRLPTLDARTDAARNLEAVEKRDLCPGDWVLVTTRNSVYVIGVLGDGRYLVSGGWFDRHGASPQEVGIAGCSWGGSAIKTDIVAARGLFLEFGNSVITTRIQGVRVVRYDQRNLPVQ